MSNNLLTNLSLSNLRRAVSLKEQIISLESELSELIGASSPSASLHLGRKRMGGRTRSAASRAKMAAAQRARWAKLRGGMSEAPARKGRRKVSSEVRAKLAKAARARWAKVRASGKNSLAD